MRKNLNISQKLIIGLLAFCVFNAAIVSIVIALRLKSHAGKEAENIRSNEMEDIRQSLVNYVNIAYETIDSNYKASQNKNNIIKRYGKELNGIIDMSFAVIKKYQKQADNGEISLDEAKSNAASEISVFRYDNGSGYIWINDMGKPFPKMIMHPTVPDLNGRVMDNPKYNCALGEKKNLFKAFVEVCEKNNEGYVDYLWPKPTKKGLTRDMPKLSYVRLYPEWGWIVGTGVYVDDALEDAVEIIKSQVEKMRYDNGVGYFWINDMGKPYPKMIMHPTVPSLNGKIMDDKKYNCALGKNENLFKAFVDVCEKNGRGFVDYLWPKPTKKGLTKEQPKLSFVKLYEPLGWIIGTGVYIDSVENKINNMLTNTYKQINHLILNTVGIISSVLLLLSVIVYFIVSKNICTPIQKARDIAAAVADGNLDLTFDMDRGDEIGKLAQAMKKMTHNLHQKSDLAYAISKGDLTNDAVVVSDDDVLGMALRAMSMNLNKMISVLKESVISVATGAENISETSFELSTGAANQARSVQEISESISNIDEETKENARKADEANKLAVLAQQTVEKGVRQKEEMVEAMKSINDSVNKIVTIMGLINDIAFQTNLLALNASVEAARAGKYGKGFSVVAQEVGHLSQRTSRAASEIKEILESSVKCVKDGTVNADEMAVELDKINESVVNAAELVDEISKSSKIQAEGISKINKGLDRISQVTEKNTSKAEEISSASEMLTTQAINVQDQIERFKIKE